MEGYLVSVFLEHHVYPKMHSNGSRTTIIPVTFPGMIAMNYTMTLG